MFSDNLGTFKKKFIATLSIIQVSKLCNDLVCPEIVIFFTTYDNLLAKKNIFPN